MARSLPKRLRRPHGLERLIPSEANHPPLPRLAVVTATAATP